MSVILWLLVLSSGSVLCTAVSKRKYEEALPVTCSLLVLLLFLSGICGALKEGVYCALGISLCIYIASAAFLIQKRAIRNFLERLFTPGFWIFISMVILSCILSFGRMASSWDEFSHWADIVKVMVTLDDFGTNPEAHSIFQSYPPAMTLFQYFLQKLSGWMGNSNYTEWKLFLAYHVFALSFFIPFAKVINSKKRFAGIIFGILVYLCPLWFFWGIYTTIYIDPFLGILSGTGLAAIFLEDKKDAFYSLRIFLTCAILVLAKDAGMMFAAILALAYVLDLWFAGAGKEGEVKGKSLWNHKKLWISRLLWTLGVVAAVLVPKQIWSYHLKARNANIMFSGSVDIKVLFHVLFSGEWSYRRAVLGKYVRYLFHNGSRIGVTTIYLSYFWIAMLFLALLIVLLWKYRKKSAEYSAKGVRLFLVVCLQFFVYIVGLVIMYMFKFSEYEALGLASIDRYLGIVFSSVWILIVLLALHYFSVIAERKYATGLLLLGIMLLVTPIQYVKSYFNRESVQESIAVRSRYEKLCSLIEEVVPEQANVFLVSQADNGFDRLVLRYSIRPRRASSEFWSVGKPFYEEDVYTYEMDAEQWMDYLVAEFDYVALYKVNDYFLANFEKLFEPDGPIEDNMVYYINKDTRRLEKCR